jgi:hypothetical protein
VGPDPAGRPPFLDRDEAVRFRNRLADCLQRLGRRRKKKNEKRLICFQE